MFGEDDVQTFLRLLSSKYARTRGRNVISHANISVQLVILKLIKDNIKIAEAMFDHMLQTFVS